MSHKEASKISFNFFKSIKNIKGRFAFHNKYNRVIVMSHCLAKIDGFTEESPYNIPISEILKNSNALSTIFSLQRLSYQTGAAHKYINFENNNTEHNVMIKASRIIDNNQYIGTFFDLLPMSNNKNNRNYSILGLNEPDLLVNTLIEKSAGLRCFQIRDVIVKLSILEIKILYYILCGYTENEMSIKLNLYSSKIRIYISTIYSKFMVKKKYELMNLFFSSSLLGGYGYELNNSFSLEQSLQIKELIRSSF